MDFPPKYFSRFLQPNGRSNFEFRINRADVPYVFADGDTVEIGKGRILVEGNDVTLLVSGIPLFRTLKARELLEKRGIGARVVELHTLKPLDTELILACAGETAALVTVEEHSIIGGLYGAVAETLAQQLPVIPVSVVPVGIRDTFTCTGPDPETLWDHVGLRPEDIAAAAERAVQAKDKSRR